jgi:hypothetical protein
MCNFVIKNVKSIDDAQAFLRLEQQIKLNQPFQENSYIPALTPWTIWTWT